KIGAGFPCLVIAELSANHGGSLARALELVGLAKECGADAIKFQTYTPDTITLKCDSPLFKIGPGTIWAGRTLHDLYAEAFTPWEWHANLFAAARSAGLLCFSSPFDATAVEFLETLGCPAYKIASFELNDISLIQKASATGKPLVLSTGMATLPEIHEAVEAARADGNGGLALLKCTSGYPAPVSDMNLRTIPALVAEFGVPVGLSDHTPGISAPVVATALGASIIEKHLTIRRSDGGPDAAFSLEPEEFRAMVRAVRDAEASLGEARFEPGPSEMASRKFRRSLFAVKDIAEGEEFTATNIRSIRPADGLHPRHFSEFIGKCSRRKLTAGTPLTQNDLPTNQKKDIRK
ncbi:MAG: pseudaminic acid synthase, partial [Terrimicrobiaceae bacterium]